MAAPLPPAAALLDALDEPALIVRGQRTVAINRAAHALLGPSLTQGALVGRDVRFAIRHPPSVGPRSHLGGTGG